MPTNIGSPEFIDYLLERARFNRGQAAKVKTETEVSRGLIEDSRALIERTNTLLDMHKLSVDQSRKQIAKSRRLLKKL